MNLSLTTRISLLFAACAAAVLLALGWVVSRAVEAHFVEMDRHELHGKLALVGNLLARAGHDGRFDMLPQQLRDALVGHHGLSMSVRAPDGAVLFASGDAPWPSALLTPPFPAEDREQVWTAGDRAWRALVAPVNDGTGQALPHGVGLALEISHHRHFMRAFHQTLGIIVALAALFTAALGWAATRAGLRPLTRMAALAGGLSASRLTERLPETPLPAEMRALVAAFNTMLARLEDSFRRLSEFSSDIAHELRTPVSNLMTQTQVALTRARTLEEYRELLGSNLEEYERLARMIGDMLFLAQADNHLLAPRREPVDLVEEVARLFEFYEALAADRSVRLRQTGAAQVAADRAMLRRALANLLSNALRHTAPGGTVTVTLSETDDTARMVVSNPGEIPRVHLARLFERFYTGDPARRFSGEGAGLGLAIARSIARMHDGELRADNRHGQACFTLTLDRRATPAPDSPVPRSSG